MMFNKILIQCYWVGVITSSLQTIVKHNNFNLKYIFEPFKLNWGGRLRVDLSMENIFLVRKFGRDGIGCDEHQIEKKTWIKPV